MFILLTGAVHEGKTTACWKAIPGIRSAGLKVAGFISPPLLDAGGAKVGIEMIDLTTGQHQTFARVVEAAHLGCARSAAEEPGAPATVGVYQTSEEAVDWARRVLAAAMLANADWIAIDEIGPLELHEGRGFAFALQPLADPIRVPNAIVIIRATLADELAERLGRTDVVRVHLTGGNRSQIPARLVKLVRSARN